MKNLYILFLLMFGVSSFAAGLRGEDLLSVEADSAPCQEAFNTVTHYKPWIHSDVSEGIDIYCTAASAQADEIYSAVEYSFFVNRTHCIKYTIMQYVDSVLKDASSHSEVIFLFQHIRESLMELLATSKDEKVVKFLKLNLCAPEVVERLLTEAISIIEKLIEAEKELSTTYFTEAMELGLNLIVRILGQVAFVEVALPSADELAWLDSRDEADIF